MLLVVESHFGNTAAIAETLAFALRNQGADVDYVPADTAPAITSADLVLVGAPTHSLGLPTPATRAQAAQKGAVPAPTGVREWIATTQGLSPPVVTFATKTRGAFTGSASKAAAKLLRRRGASATQGPDFFVLGVSGPLADGEVERAAEWGVGLLR
ncbi:flavodoxin family protein [Cellulomonas endometrii]|uniref:flavodoxin family protein n=1 Tax=Cellulomonas endometrii TaxID=3036301 RepID=UPI0024AD91AB|nr:flavodoxin domain-containing protein [Cellulomonas endometrii]